MTVVCTRPQSRLLDMNSLSDLVRNPVGFIASAGDANVWTSIIAVAELRFGARRSVSLRLRGQVDRSLAAIAIMPFDTPADQHRARVRAASNVVERSSAPTTC